MDITNNSDAAKLALLAMCAEDTFKSLADDDRGNLFPTPDPRISQAGWNIVGNIIGKDATQVERKIGLGEMVYYGFLAQSKLDASEYVAVIRGTEDILEWIENVEFLPVQHPSGGNVEDGFFSIYLSMEFIRSNKGQSINLANGIANIVGNNRVIVTGHSLGSALATYLTYDLAYINNGPNWGSSCLFASPNPGDEIFATNFEAVVGHSNYTVYNYSRDKVPTLPPTFFCYTHLQNTIKITPLSANAKIFFSVLDLPKSLGASHHAVCYAAMLDYQAADWKNMPDIDKDCAACIVGPNP